MHKWNDKDINDKYDVKHKLSYKIYRMPKKVLEAYEERNDEYNGYIGYQNWHDPNIYKPFSGQINPVYYERQKVPIPGFVVKNFEYIGTFKYDEFEWFNKPSSI